VLLSVPRCLRIPISSLHLQGVCSFLSGLQAVADHARDPLYRDLFAHTSQLHAMQRGHVRIADHSTIRGCGQAGGGGTQVLHLPLHQRFGNDVKAGVGGVTKGRAYKMHTYRADARTHERSRTGRPWTGQ